MALVPYRGGSDTQRPNLALQQQQITDTREGDLSHSVAHVQYRGDTQHPRLAMQQQEQEANPEREVRHLKLFSIQRADGECRMIAIKRQQPVETAHRELGMSFSMALVPYCGDSDTQRPNLALQQQQIEEVADQEREVRHFKGLPTQFTDGECQAVTLQQQRALDIATREGELSPSMALVPDRGDTHRLRLTMQQQVRDTVNRGHEV